MGFSGGLVAKDLPANAGDGVPSLVWESPLAAAGAWWSPRTTKKRNPGSPQLEKAHTHSKEDLAPEIKVSEQIFKKRKRDR